MQLDIFQDSRDVMLRNDIVAALECRDPVGAEAACDRLAHESPVDASLAPSRALARSLRALHGPSFDDPAELCMARLAVEELQAAADIVLAARSIPWLRGHWAALARRGAGIAFRTERPADHAAPLWIRAGDWKAAESAVASIESWRRIPAPLGWMAEVRLRLLGLPSSWPLIAELGWLSPGRLDALMQQAVDPVLVDLWRRFGQDFESDGGDEAAWFAAWVLTVRPGVVDLLAPAQASRHTDPERAFRVLVELLGLERQGRQRDIAERRKQLRDLNPALYGHYMRSR